MTVWVDSFRAKKGNMVMSHMIADTRSELEAMIGKLKLNWDHIQDPCLRNEHYDIVETRRQVALQLGAQEITSRELVYKLRARDTKHYLEH